ncbi:MAG: N-acetylmuramoyl-L-alanine amidase [Patescibacteria group bacterium]
MRTLFVVALFLAICAPAKAGSLDGLTVVIDPGHGNDDHGTRRRYGQQLITEAQLTWGVASELRPLLTADGATVRLTTMQHRLPSEWPPLAVFGRDTIPARGADVFMTWGQPSIRGGRAGLEQRFARARQVLASDSTATVLYLSLHFDHVLGRGCPAGARIIYPAGPYDTLLVVSMVSAFSQAGLLRADEDGPTVANGRSGLGRHLFILRQPHDLRRYRDRLRGRTRLVYNPVPRSLLIELANLPNNADWRRLQTSGALRRYAQVIRDGLVLYRRASSGSIR